MQADSDSDDVLPRWFGDYALLKRLGRGGMGQVFLARLPGVAGIDRACVIKTLRARWTADREYVARFVDEARTVVQLAHRNICPVFDVGLVGGTYYLAMDLVAGRDLHEVMERCRAHGMVLPLDLSLLIVAEILEALDAAHRLRDPETDVSLGLVHRDVSPHNVLVGFDGDVKLIDFGLAQSALKQERTEPGIVLGKLAYMAPEHARGFVVDARADLFAVGVVLYELLAGERYWEGLSMTAIWENVGLGTHRPRQLEALPAAVRDVILRATAAAPADRFKSGAEMRAAIAAVQLARGVLATSSDLRAQLDVLFPGEAVADRRERAALMKLALPEAAPAVARSRRIASAPGPAAPDLEPDAPTLEVRAQDVPGDDELDTARDLKRPDEQTASASDEDPVTDRDGTELVRRRPPPRPADSGPADPVSTTPRSSRRLTFVAAAVVFGVVLAGGLSWWRSRGADLPAPVVASPSPPSSPPPPSSSPPPSLPPPTAAPPVAPPPPPAPTPVTSPVATPPPTVPRVAPPPPAPSPPPPAPALVAPSLPPSPPSSPPPAPAPLVPTSAASAPWPSTWPRLPEARQQLLRERCVGHPCAAALLLARPRELDAPALESLQRRLQACLETCRGAIP